MSFEEPESLPCPTPADVRAALAGHPRLDLPALPGRKNHLASGVLVPLVWKPAPVCIVTVRSAELRRHAGEVCFPGGRPDASDRDLAHTALREAEEELGITEARILGELSSMPLFTSDYRLQPFVAEIASTDFVVNQAEVAHVLEIDVRRILEQPSIPAIAWEHEGLSGLSPIFELGAHRMYGATAHSFHELLLVLAPLFGREPPPLEPISLTWAEVLGARA